MSAWTANDYDRAWQDAGCPNDRAWIEELLDKVHEVNKVLAHREEAVRNLKATIEKLHPNRVLELETELAVMTSKCDVLQGWKEGALIGAGFVKKDRELYKEQVDKLSTVVGTLPECDCGAVATYVAVPTTWAGRRWFCDGCRDHCAVQNCGPGPQYTEELSYAPALRKLNE